MAKRRKKLMKDEYRLCMLTIPAIEKVLKSNVTYYEKCVLIEKHIDNWRISP